MIGGVGHVGSRVSALVDGQLPPAETERLWAHVHRCSACWVAVQREGWVKRQLLGLAASSPAPSYGLRGALAHPGAVPVPNAVAADGRPVDALGLDHRTRRRVVTGVAVGAGSIGAAMVGVLALSVPAEAPTQDRRTPTVSINQPTGTPTPAPAPISTIGRMAP